MIRIEKPEINRMIQDKRYKIKDTRKKYKIKETKEKTNIAICLEGA